MSWSSAESGPLSRLASIDWPQSQASMPHSSQKPQAAPGWLSQNVEVVDCNMIIVN